MTNTGTDTAGLSSGRVGERLVAAREALGLSVDDIAERTRVPVRHLHLIEAGETQGLPATPYSVGFVRTYASAVGLDPADIARQFRGELGQTVARATPEPFEPADPARVPPKLLVIVALAIALLIAAGYALWRGDGLFGSAAQDRDRLAAGSDTVIPGPEGDAPAVPGAAPAPPAPVGGAVTITATAPAWIKVTDGAETLFMGMVEPGQSVPVPATAVDPRIRTAAAQSLAILVGDSAVVSIGPPAQLVKDVSLKPAALLARGAAPADLRAEPLMPTDNATAPPRP